MASPEVAPPASPGSSNGSSGSSSSIDGRFRRRKLPQYNTIDDAVELIRDARNLLVLSGAGISTSCGIPDFRSRTGIYAQIEASGQFPQLDEPSQLFDIDTFKDNPEIFYSFAKQIYPGAHEPSPSHKWIKGLEDRGKLLRQYTQNIDGLDVKAGVKNVLQCHGSFDTASCIRCNTPYPGSAIEGNILTSTVPPCPWCTAQRAADREARQSGVKKKKKRKWAEDDESSDEDPWDSGPPPILKPDICFFGENVFAKCPQFGPSVMSDREKVDLVLVMGTSLKVAPVADILQVLPPEIPQILINMTPILHFEMDIMLLGESDKIVRWLSSELGWEEGFKEEGDELAWRSGTEEFAHLHILGPKDGPAPFFTIELDGGEESDGAEDEEDDDAQEELSTSRGSETRISELEEAINDPISSRPCPPIPPLSTVLLEEKYT